MNAMRPFVAGAVAWETVATKPAQIPVRPMIRSALRRFTVPPSIVGAFVATRSKRAEEMLSVSLRER